MRRIAFIGSRYSFDEYCQLIGATRNHWDVRKDKDGTAVMNIESMDSVDIVRGLDFEKIELAPKPEDRPKDYEKIIFRLTPFLGRCKKEPLNA